MKPTATDDLVLRYLDQRLTDAEARDFQQRVADDPDVRERLLLHAAIMEGLAEPEAFSATATFPVVSDKPQNASRLRRNTWVPWTIAAVASLLAAFAFRTRPAPAPTAPDDPNLAALLVNEAAAVFAPDRGPDGFRFLPGDYELQDGSAHLRFANGADFVVSAPARFRIEDGFHVELDAGDVRVFAPPSAHGFTIVNGDLELVDYGTEFGVSIEEAGAAQSLHVFAGRVDAHRRGDEALLGSILGGEAVRFENGEMHPLATPETNVFPDVSDVAIQRWRAKQNRVLEDPALLFHFPFEIPAHDRDASLVLNMAPAVPGAAAAAHGRLLGAREVSGRWPGKRALLFDGASDHLELDLGENHRELTIALWLRPDGFDHAINAVFDSNGWKDGGLHLQVDRSGRPWAGVFDPKVQIYAADALLQPGRWHHLALTLSSLDGEFTLYVDGQRAAHRSDVFAPDTRHAPGLCRIANWAWDGVWASDPRRNFRCAIDEFSVWTRALSADECAALHEVGRPFLIPYQESPRQP